MKRSRFTEERIIGILREHQVGMSAAELCRKHGIIEAWRIDYNHIRPHTRLNGLTPIEFAAQQARSLELNNGSAINPVEARAQMGENQNRLYLRVGE